MLWHACAETRERIHLIGRKQDVGQEMPLALIVFIQESLPYICTAAILVGSIKLLSFYSFIFICRKAAENVFASPKAAWFVCNSGT